MGAERGPECGFEEIEGVNREKEQEPFNGLGTDLGCENEKCKENQRDACT